MEVIRKKYKYRCELCKTDVLDLNFEDFKKDSEPIIKRGCTIPVITDLYIHKCPVCKYINVLDNCKIYKQYKIVNKEEIIEVSDED